MSDEVKTGSGRQMPRQSKPLSSHSPNLYGLMARTFTAPGCFIPHPSALIPFLTGGGAPCYTLNSSGKLSEVCIK
jgi:hypothetical protein